MLFATFYYAIIKCENLSSGSEWPEEIILLSGHMDTWDVGQGALDDGGGIAAVWQAMYAILKLGKTDDVFIPKRLAFITKYFLQISSFENKEIKYVLYNRGTL